MALNQREKRKDPVKSWCVTFKILELAILDFKKKKTPKLLTILLEEGSTEEHGLCHKADRSRSIRIFTPAQFLEFTPMLSGVK